MFEKLGTKEFLPQRRAASDLYGRMCTETPTFCLQAIEAICGYNDANINITRLPLYLSYTPAGQLSCVTCNGRNEILLMNLHTLLHMQGASLGLVVRTSLLALCQCLSMNEQLAPICWANTAVHTAILIWLTLFVEESSTALLIARQPVCRSGCLAISNAFVVTTLNRCLI